MRKGVFAMASMVVIFCTAVAQGTSWSQKKGPVLGTCNERFMRMDSDRDGKISLDEFRSFPHPEGEATAIFRIRDTNRDGYLTKEELCKTKGARRKKPQAPSQKGE